MDRQLVRAWCDLAALGAAIGRGESSEFNRLGAMATRLKEAERLGVTKGKGAYENPCHKLRHWAVVASILCPEDHREVIGKYSAQVLSLCAAEGVRP